MSSKKIITIFGATGAQGGSVVKKFLTDPKLNSTWTVRAVTRDATKDSAKKLQSEGAEVVTADMNDKSSLVAALTGAAATFAVTNYWEKMDAELEVKQGKDLVDAAKETGVQHFIWSSLVNVTKLSNGKLPNVYHFDSKAEVEQYARQAGIPATFFMPGFYMTNIAGGIFRPMPPTNAWTFGLPIPGTAQIPLYDTANDTGTYIKAIVLNREKVLGKQILGATAYMTGNQMVESFKKRYPEAGATATYVNLPHEVYTSALTGLGLPAFAAEELLENMRLMDEYGYYGGLSLDETHALIAPEDKLTTWEEFMAQSDKMADLK